MRSADDTSYCHILARPPVIMQKRVCSHKCVGNRKRKGCGCEFEDFAKNTLFCPDCRQRSVWGK